MHQRLRPRALEALQALRALRALQALQAWVAVVVHCRGKERGELIERPEHLAQQWAAQEVLQRDERDLTTLPPYYLTTLLPYHLTTLPPYYLTTLLPYYLTRVTW